MEKKITDKSVNQIRGQIKGGDVKPKPTVDKQSILPPPAPKPKKQ